LIRWNWPRQAETGPTNGDSMRALIVDDSQLARHLLRALLAPLGIECEEAADGAEGLARLHGSAPFDLALVDWNMPGMSGLEMLEKMRAAGFTAVKVLMVTAEDENESISRALDAGADEYLMKPFEPEALSDKLAMLGLVEA
jgi:two-component system, chemotaxis family, chemotaxis protein CheY